MHVVPERQARELALKALAELQAADPDESPVKLLGGWDSYGKEPLMRVEMARDPANEPAMRPHVVAPCQQLARQPALRLHCTCGRGLDFLALAPFATGVLVVSSPRLLSKKKRKGGTEDLAPIFNGDPDARWTLFEWESAMHDRASRHATAWDPKPHPALGKAGIVGDTAKRQTFHCKGCEATHTFINVTLLTLALEAIAAGSREVRLDDPGGFRHVERAVGARSRGGSPPLPLPPAPARLHVCTQWCLGSDHIERAEPADTRSDDELRAGFDRLGLEVTLIEPTPEHMNLPGELPGRLVWFKTREGVQ